MLAASVKIEVIHFFELMFTLLTEQYKKPEEALIVGIFPKRIIVIKLVENENVFTVRAMSDLFK